ncbi:MAG: helix-turn-helix transcriptional regulator [Lachnospiraceae bacterium]|nr:helix-turn-helix transcriptional regulator [Lachnospiraceae bacterium]
MLMFPVVPPFDVVYRNAEAPFPVGPHSHNAVEIYFTLTDLPDVLLNYAVSAIPAGTLIIIPAFCIHQLYHETGTTYERYILSINSDWIRSVFCEGAAGLSYMSDSPTPLLVFPDIEQKDRLILLFKKMLTCPSKTTPEAMTDFFRLLSVIHSIAVEIAPKHQTDLPVSPTQKKVNDIILYLHDHLHEPINIRDMASHFYLNPDYLARLFKNHTHISIGRYITLQKIDAAESLLREGKSVSEAQEALGYSSYAYFFKTFQKITGISPSKYRNLYRS